MRENWNRASQTLEFTIEELTRMIAPVFPARKVVASFYTQGGLANTNIRLQVTDTQIPIVLRVFVNDPSQAEKEYRIYQLLDGKIAAPKIYHFSATNDVSGHPYMIMQWAEGDRLESLVSGLDTSWSLELGRSIGATLATIHSVKFPATGFLDGNLNVSTPFDMGAIGFIAFAERCLQDPELVQRVDAELRQQILKFIHEESRIFDQWKGLPSLTHCDFNGSNVLVRRVASGWKVSAVLDWEFALSATPFIDFGNLLREPLGSVEGFQRSLFEGYTASGGELPEQWLAMSRLSDMTAWLDFLTRPAAGARLVSDAQSMILKTMTGWYQKR